ncbi:hypothetical protein MOKP76_13990 [Mycobacterium avium subsp. hominissuis]
MPDPRPRRLTVGVVAESGSAERRVALVPEAVASLASSGLAVVVESGAGQGALLRCCYYPTIFMPPSAGARAAHAVTGVRLQDPVNAAARAGMLDRCVRGCQVASSTQVTIGLADRAVTPSTVSDPWVIVRSDRRHRPATPRHLRVVHHDLGRASMKSVV